MKNFIRFNWRVARYGSWKVALFWVILFSVGFAVDRGPWLQLLWILPMLIVLSHIMLLCNTTIEKNRPTKWLVIVDHYGDHKIVEFADEAGLESYMLEKKYYTLAYNERFTRCGAMNQKQTNVVFANISQKTK